LCWTELQAVEATGNKVLTWEQMLGMGAAKPVLADPPKPDDLSTIMYTSGTTGGLL
jgi:long-chain acyl-CoA synthetase